jgi:hypothetical protein
MESQSPQHQHIQPYKLKTSLAVVEILRFLDPKQLMQLQGVNKRFYNYLIPAVVSFVATFIVRDSVIVFPKQKHYYKLSYSRPDSWEKIEFQYY